MYENLIATVKEFPADRQPDGLKVVEKSVELYRRSKLVMSFLCSSESQATDVSKQLLVAFPRIKMISNDDVKFARWLNDIDKELERSVGLSRDDLPDCTYRDWYDDGVPAKVAARRAIREANSY